MARMLGLAALSLGAAVLIGCGGSSDSQPVFVNPDEIPPLSASDADEIKSWDDQINEAERAQGAETLPSKSKKR